MRSFVASSCSMNESMVLERGLEDNNRDGVGEQAGTRNPSGRYSRTFRVLEDVYKRRLQEKEGGPELCQKRSGGSDDVKESWISVEG
jgi:hypothetical protein